MNLSPIDHAVSTRSFNLTDVTHRVCQCVQEGDTRKAERIIQEEFAPPEGHAYAILPITRAENAYIREVIQSNPKVIIQVIDPNTSRRVR